MQLSAIGRSSANGRFTPNSHRCKTPSMREELNNANYPKKNPRNVVHRLRSDKLVPPVSSCRINKAVEPQSQCSTQSAYPVSSVTPALSVNPKKALQTVRPLHNPRPEQPTSGIRQPYPSNPQRPQIRFLHHTQLISLLARRHVGISTCDEFSRVIFAPAVLFTQCNPTLGVLVQSKGRMLKVYEINYSWGVSKGALREIGRLSWSW